ncbi:MAG: SRPBCC family protein [Halodesulfurarchaeum sp.]
MATATASRELRQPPDAVREYIRSDVMGFLEASGFDEVTREGEDYRVAKDIGLARLELVLSVEETEGVLALDQVDGIFDEMWTEYHVEEAEAGSLITAMTEFTLGGVLAPVLDPTMIRSQRIHEFELQFEYLETIESTV